MAYLFAGGVAACSFGLVDCDFSNSMTPVEINQCVEADKQLKTEYGDDYLTNRNTMPITSYGLQYIKAIGCESTFGYDTLADSFCQSLENYNAQIGGGQTCGTTKDPNNSMRARWCLNEEGPDTSTSNGILIGANASDRLKADSKCAQTMLSDKYDDTWVKYCKAKPDDLHCTCYNMKNNVCGVHSEAAGCTYYKILEDNKNAFSTSEERAALESASNLSGEDLQDPESYNILKSKGHCRPRSCNSGYIPPNVKSDCAATYPICGEDIDIRTNTNNNIAVKCNYDPDKLRTLPDWWNEERDTTFMDEALARGRARQLAAQLAARKKNQSLIYGGVGSFTLCCCIVMMVVMMGLKKR